MALYENKIHLYYKQKKVRKEWQMALVGVMVQHSTVSKSYREYWIKKICSTAFEIAKTYKVQ